MIEGLARLTAGLKARQAARAERTLEITGTQLRLLEEMKAEVALAQQNLNLVATAILAGEDLTGAKVLRWQGGAGGRPATMTVELPIPET